MNQDGNNILAGFLAIIKLLVIFGLLCLGIVIGWNWGLVPVFGLAALTFKSCIGITTAIFMVLIILLLGKGAMEGKINGHI